MFNQLVCVKGRGPDAVVKLPAWKAIDRGLSLALAYSGFKGTTVSSLLNRFSIVWNPRDREVACSTSEFRVLCLDVDVITFISPSSGGFPGPV